MIKLISCVILSLVFGTASADYWLIMYDLSLRNDDETYHNITYPERFVSYSDCRDRGLKNQSLLQYGGVRAGFACWTDEEMETLP